jgi:hypothetical protein
MAIANISTWLRNKGAFQDGVELLKLHGNPSPTDLFIFGLPESPMNRGKLEDALRRIDTKFVQSTIAAAPVSKTRPRDAHDVDERALQRSLQPPPDTLPELSLPMELRPLRRRLDRLWREKTLLRGSLLSLPNGPQLKATASKVKALGKEIRAGWVVIERWRTHGIIIDMDKAPALDLVALHKKRDSLRVQLSNYKHGKRKYTPDEVAAKQAALDDVIKLIEHGPQTASV